MRACVYTGFAALNILVLTTSVASAQSVIQVTKAKTHQITNETPPAPRKLSEETFGPVTPEPGPESNMNVTPAPRNAIPMPAPVITPPTQPIVTPPVNPMGAPPPLPPVGMEQTPVPAPASSAPPPTVTTPSQPVMSEYIATNPQTGWSTPSAGSTQIIYSPTSQLFGNNSFLRINTPLTFHMLDFQNRQTDKELRILEDAPRRGNGPSLTVGGQFRATALYGETDTENSFPYLGRFPPDFVGNTATDLRLLQANQAFVFHANNWAHGYFETLFSDVFSFRSFNQGSFQVRQAYVVLGDLDVSPFYAFLGKKNVSFGDFRTLSPFSQAMPWHYFAALAEGGGVGFSSNGLQAQFMALAGGRGIRVSDSESIGTIENFAANVRYDVELNPNLAVGIGAGYLRGTIYDATTAEHTNPAIVGPFNGAWDINGSIHAGPIRIGAEFVQTENEWPVTGTRITAWQTEAAYDFLVDGVPCTFSGSFSEGRQGPAGSEFEFNRQLVFGLKVQPSPNAFFTAEYVRSTGFAPLINITTASNRDVEQNSLVLGFVLAI